MNSNVWRPIAIALLTFILGAGATWTSSATDRSSLAAEVKDLKQDIVDLKVEQARLEEKVDILLKRFEK